MLDLDGVLAPQLDRLGRAVRRVDLTDIAGTRYACEPATLDLLRERLRGVPLDAVLLGSGDHHHLALLALERHERPFTLVLFDHHADHGPTDLLTCGSWVASALALGHLREVVLVGVGELPDPLPDRVRPATIADLDRLAGPIHVSVDKDVLDPADATTGWSQGAMRLDALCAALRSLRDRVVAFDVCGEAPLGPLDLLTPAGRAAVARNLRANRAILDALDPS